MSTRVEAIAAPRLGAIGRMLLVVGTVTVARIALLGANATDLFVDEAQYWLWGQALDWGYYSKPPLIGWTIRAVTDLAGSDAAFWIRLPGALFHGAAAVLLGLAARELYGPRPAVWVAAAYVTLPMAALGSLLISTDTIMAPFYALALWMWLRMARGGGIGSALVCGAALGAAVLAKYAGAYFLVFAGLAAAVVPAMRIPWRYAAATALSAALIIAPNVAWNLANDLATLSHTADNVQWVRGAGPVLNLAGATAFALSQFAVFGPVLFGALLVATVRPGDAWQRGLLWMSLPIVIAIVVQAGLSRAYANWAVAAYFAATLAVVPWLVARHPRWLAASFAINGAICVILPLLAVFPRALGPEDAPLLQRYLGRTALSVQAVDVARAAGVVAIVAGHRDLLADLAHTARDAGLPIRAVPAAGPPPHYYAQRFALTDAVAGPVLWVARVGETSCGGRPLAPVARFETAGGAYAEREIAAYLVPAGCRYALDPAR